MVNYDACICDFWKHGMAIDSKAPLHANGEVHELLVKDSIWLPARTELIYETDSALVHFAIHPSNWHDARS